MLRSGLNLEAKVYCKLSLITETLESSQENSEVSMSIRHCWKDFLNMKHNTMSQKYATFIGRLKKVKRSLEKKAKIETQDCV